MKERIDREVGKVAVLCRSPNAVLMKNLSTAGTVLMDSRMALIEKVGDASRFCLVEIVIKSGE